MSKYELMIPNATSDAGYCEVVAPYDGKVIGSIAVANKSAIETALKNAKALFEDKSKWLPSTKRIKIFENTIKIMEDRAEDLALEAAHEGGKPLLDSRVEVARAIDGLKCCIETMRTASGTEIPMDLNASSQGKLAFTTHEPIGIVVAVSAFNHPLNLIVHQVGPAIATGCPVIVKPATDTALSCFSFCSILIEAGLPKEWCQPVLIKDRDIATGLVTDPRVAFFSFIGSANVGWSLRSKVAKGTRCALEHGGVAPVIVDQDANLDEAVPLLTKGGLYHAGQVCVSVQRVYAHQSIAKRLAEKIADSAKNLKVGDPTLETTDIGPLIRHTEVDRVEQWVNEAIKEGAQALTGAKRISKSCFECTVLYNPSEKSKVSQMEIFGPVVCIYPYNDIDQAIAQANSLPVAFQAAVFTTNINTAMKAFKQLNASAVMINEHTAFRVDWMPFAGLRESGLAVGGIPHTMHDMQIEKMMVLRSKEL